MITVSIFRSTLDDTRETQRIENPITIKELYPDVDFEGSIISVNGFLQDENYLLKDGDICTIRLFPKGNDTGLATGGFLGAILGGLTFLIPGVGAFLAVGLFFAGAIAGGLAGEAIQHGSLDRLFGSNPNESTKGQVEQIPQLRGAKNQSNLGKPVPLVLGKHLLTPMYVGTPYTEISGVDGEDQYFYALYMLGYGKLRVTDVKLGVIGDLASNKQIVNNAVVNKEVVTDGRLKFNGDPFLRDGNPELDLIQSERESKLYEQAVFEERLNIELSNPGEADNENPAALNVVRFTARNPQKIQIEITLPSGLIKYNKEGKPQDKSVEISVAWRRSRPDNSDNWKPFTRFGADQLNITETEVSDGAGSRLVSKITRRKTKVMRFAAEKTFNYYSEVADAFDTRVIELQIYRVDDQSDNSNIIDKVYLTAIRTWMFDNEKSNPKTNTENPAGKLIAQVPVIEKLRDKTSRLAFKIKASQNTQGMLDALNCIVESKCRTYNTETNTWSEPDWNIKTQKWNRDEYDQLTVNETPTNNPASLALKLLQSPTMGRRAYPDSMLDMEAFGEFYKWCEDRKYSCNGVLTAEKRLDEVLALILSTGRAMCILNGNRYGLLIDQEREYPVMIVNSQNVLEATNQKSFADLPDGFLIKYVNEADGYQQTEEYVMKDGTNQPKPESVIESIEIPFVTNYEQIVKIGWYLLACRYLRPEIWHRKLSVDGYLIAIGDMVEVQDDTIAVGIGEGAVIKNLVIENDTIIEIQTDGVFDVVDMNQDYGIKIMQLDGINAIGRNSVRTIKVDIEEPGIYSNFPVKIPLNNTPIPSKGDIVAFGIYNRITTKALCFGKKDNGDNTFDVTLVPYQEGIYTTDSGEIPPYRANITSPQGMVPAPLPENITLSDVIETVSNLDLGQAAVSFDLQPSVRIIVQGNDGTFTPDRISCAQFITVGNELPVPSDRMMQYITSKNSEAALYLPNTAILVSDWDWIEFILSDQGVELDRQRVPVLREGSDAVFLDLENQNTQIRCYYDGTPKEGQIPFTMQATLFRGTAVANPEWTLANAPRGITIDRNGLITVNSTYKYLDDIPRYPSEDETADPMPEPFYPTPPEEEWEQGALELQDDNEIAVKAYYNGKLFSRIFRIRKVRDGVPGNNGLGIDQIPRDAILHWSCDEIIDGTVIDNSGNGRHGVIENDVTSAHGKFGNGLFFDIFSSVGVDLPAVDDFTLSLWVSNATDIYKFIAHSNWRIGINLGRLVITIDDNAYDIAPFIYEEYNHILVRKENNIIELYINGEHISFEQTFSIIEAPLNIGSMGDIYGLVIDEVIIFNRAVTDIEADILFRTTLPKVFTEMDYNWKTRWEDAYLGSITVADTGNTGIINGYRQVRAGNYVMFSGETIGTWRKGYMYQWDGTRWNELASPADGDMTNGWRYNDAVWDVTERQGNAAFLEAYIRHLQVHTAFIRNLFMMNAVLRADGSIESEGFVSIDDATTQNPAKGCKIWANGKAEFNDIVARGTIKAKTGTFFDACKFHGDLDCGSLQVADDPNSLKRFPVSGVYTGSQTYATVMTEMATAMGITYNEFISRPRTFIVNSGVITIVNVSHNIVSILTESNRIVITYIHSATGRENTFSVSPSFGAISAWFQLGTSGKKIRLVGLPLDPAAARVGTLYRKHDGYGEYMVMVKP